MNAIIVVGVVTVLFWYLVHLARKGSPQQKTISVGVMIVIVGALGVVVFGPVFFAVIAVLVWAAYNYLGWGKKGPPTLR